MHEMKLFADCRSELDEYLSLEPGWDGYRGQTFTKELVTKVLYIVDLVEQAATPGGTKLDEITPCPCGDGSVDLEVTVGSRTVFFLFDADDPDRVMVTRREGKTYTESNETLNKALVESHLDWLFQQT